MIKINSNIADVAAGLKRKLEKLKNKEYLLRPLAIDTIANMHERIHIKGLATDNQQIGTYSPQYMKVRTDAWANKQKPPQSKETEKKKAGGLPRRKYNRSNDTKVIISLTRQLENDYALQPTEKGYAIGFNNRFNKQKADWVTRIYRKQIFGLTPDERAYVLRKFNQLVSDAISK